MQNDCLALYVAMVENDAARRVRCDPKSGLTSQPTRPVTSVAMANGTETGTIDDNSDSQKLVLKCIIQSSKAGFGLIWRPGLFLFKEPELKY